MAVLAVPIGGDARGDAAEHMAGQVGDANPWEDEEAGVADDPRQRGGTLEGGQPIHRSRGAHCQAAAPKATQASGRPVLELTQYWRFSPTRNS